MSAENTTQSDVATPGRTAARPGRKGILGRKVGSTQVFDAGGAVVPVTVIQAGPCRVLLVRTADRDGYAAVQLGFRDKPRRLASRALRGQVAKLDSKRARRLTQGGVALPAKADCEPQRFVRELRGEYPGVEVGQVLSVDLFEGVERVDVTGTTKGRGTAGVMKRHGFKGQRATHGVKKVHRHQGGTSMNTSPARVFKGKRMAGRYGNERSTMRNLKLVGIDRENNLLLVRGAVPGPNGSYVVVRQTNMIKRVVAAGAAPVSKKKAGAK
ncbi:MAG: 50S ribosomal protein L3 [Planctomycetia bacterium]|nr:50S ribosomal protein L3 [Planctomycetia bacterium]